MTLPTLDQLKPKSWRSIHHQFVFAKMSSRSADRICKCGAGEFNRIHYKHVPKKKRPKPWLYSPIKIIGFDDLYEFLNERKNHRRMRVFYHKGVYCVSCGVEGTHIRVWLQHPDNQNSIHHDLFTDDLIMMTVDHIIPKSRGGGDELDNLQPMCAPCNEAKGNMSENKFLEQKEKA